MTRARQLLPKPLRLQASRALGRLVAARLSRRLRVLAAGSDPIVVGPWLSEVGFEILYWIPFLRWAIAEFQIEPRRVVVISRGGTEAWYTGLCGRYADVFDYLSAEDLRARNTRRIHALGEQKQASVAHLDREVAAMVASTLGLHRREWLHPSEMYRLFRTYWWGHAGPEWVSRHARFSRLTSPASAVPVTPGAIAVKFYFNDCFPPTAENREIVHRIVERLAEERPVVSLATGLRVDDHEDLDGSGANARGTAQRFAPRQNLAVQTATLASASAFVGTYGGFSYIAPFHGVPAIGLYVSDAYSLRHLELARSIFRAPAFGTLDAMRVDRFDPARHELTTAPRTRSGVHREEPAPATR